MRTTFCNYDSRYKSKTERWCLLCQRDITGPPKRKIHVIDGGTTILHPEDEHLYTPDSGDMGDFEIGDGCAKKLGLEWSRLREKNDCEVNPDALTAIANLSPEQIVGANASLAECEVDTATK